MMCIKLTSDTKRQSVVVADLTYLFEFQAWGEARRDCEMLDESDVLAVEAPALVLCTLDVPNALNRARDYSPAALD